MACSERGCVIFQITMLSERKVELEHRVHAIMEENELLQNTVEDLREKTMLLERQWKEKDLQVRHTASKHTHTALNDSAEITNLSQTEEGI